jgi:hypothetical protein
MRPAHVGVVVSFWVPCQGHPDGSFDVAWFRVVDGWGYRTEHNPAGSSAAPTFRVIDGFAYPTLSLSGDPPTFEVIGAFVYAPGGIAWFRIEERDRETTVRRGDAAGSQGGPASRSAARCSAHHDPGGDTDA